MAGQMARKIAEETEDGTELITFALGILRGVEYTIDDKKWAAQFLAERGAGKPQTEVNVNATGSIALTPGGVRPMLEDYTDEELAKLDELQRVATARRIVDATSTEKAP